MCIRDRDNIDWVTCSPKQGVKLEITRMNEVKVVYEGQDITCLLYTSRSACVFWLFLPVDGKVFVDVESLAMLTVLLPPTPPLPIDSCLLYTSNVRDLFLRLR